jgi:caspase domain-containing protein
VLAADHYDHAGLRDLAPSGVDTRALVDVLSSPALGGFTVEYLRDPDSQQAFRGIHDLLADRDRADVVLLYIIGQGMTGRDGQLYLAASDTDPDRLADTAIGSAWIARVMARSRADHVVMMLDCQWRLDGGTAELSDHFQPDEVDEGQSRAVICRKPSAGPHDLARAVVAGLRTGAADRNRNGYVTVDELYDYIRDQSSAQGWETRGPRPGSPRSASSAWSPPGRTWTRRPTPGTRSAAPPGTMTRRSRWPPWTSSTGPRCGCPPAWSTSVSCRRPPRAWPRTCTSRVRRWPGRRP